LRNSIYNAGTAGTSTDTSRERTGTGIHDSIKHRALEIVTEIIGRAPNENKKNQARWFERLVLTIDSGLWYCRRTDTGGNLYTLIRDELHLDHAGIVAWLRDHNYLPEAPGAEHARAWKNGNGHANGHANATNGHVHESSSNGQAQGNKEDSESEIDLDVSKLVPIEGTSGQVYFNGRGVTDIPKELRWLDEPSGPHAGKIVAPVRDPHTGTITGYHCTYVTALGENKDGLKRFAKNSIVAGSVVRIAGKGDPIEFVRGKIIIGEGVENMASIRQATGAETWASCGVNNLANLPVQEGKTYILALDGDDPDAPATRTAESAVYSLEERGARILVARPPVGFDANDVLMEHGEVDVIKYIESASVFSRIIENCEQATVIKNYVHLVEDFFVMGKTNTLTGPEGSAKTAIALDLSMHVAEGMEWCGHKVKKHNVLFIEGEDDEDTGARLRRLCEVHGLVRSKVGINMIRGRNNLLFQDEQFMKELIHDAKKFARENGPYGLIVIDSVQAYFTGDDPNKPQQGVHFVHEVKKFAKALGSSPCVLMIAHPKKNFDPDCLVPSGGQGMSNACEGNLGCIRNGDVITISVHSVGGKKWKGCRPPKTHYFELITDTLEHVRCEVDNSPIWAVRVRHIDENKAIDAEEAMLSEGDRVIKVYFDNDQLAKPEQLSFATIAKKANLRDDRGDFDRRRAQTIIKTLVETKYLKKEGTGRYKLTAAGRKYAKGLPDIMTSASGMEGMVDAAAQADRAAEDRVRKAFT
jgi:hypothetical protein